MAKRDNFIIKILKKIVNFYNTWYGLIDVVIALWLLSLNLPTWLTAVLVVLTVFECISWYRNVWKHLGTKRELFATIKQNNSMCIYGGIGSGKSTLAEYIVTRLIPENKRYYNTNRPGFKAFTNEHLLLKKRLEDGCGVVVDEAGGQADAYHYEKKDNETRKRIDFLNKFFRHWYTDKALIIYIDQAQGNVNTSIYKNIYYVLQCKGLDIKPTGYIPYLFAKLVIAILSKFTKKKYNNPFSNVAIEIMEFSKLGDYADHYMVTIDDKNHKFLVGSIYEFFTGQNTYVFRDYNPASVDKRPYIWGTNKESDALIMDKNFNLSSIQEEIKETFLKH